MILVSAAARSVVGVTVVVWCDSIISEIDAEVVVVVNRITEDRINGRLRAAGPRVEHNAFAAVKGNDISRAERCSADRFHERT